MKIKAAVRWAKFEINQLQWVIDMLPKNKLKGEAKKKLSPDYERAEKRIKAQRTLIAFTERDIPVEKIAKIIEDNSSSGQAKWESLNAASDLKKKLGI